MLQFIGTGSAFNYKLGNNSAYVKKGSTLFLIDCGSTTFSRLQKYNILDNIKHTNVLITHLHPDHVSSLGDLIFYCYFILKIKPYIYTPCEQDLISLLDIMGVNRKIYTVINASEDFCLSNDDVVMNISSVKAVHVENLKCYSYIIKYNNKSIYYSGDASEIDSKILCDLNNGKFDYFYQDTFMGEAIGIPHMLFENLCEQIDSNIRYKVYCMHLDEEFDSTLAISKGFKVVTNVAEIF